MENLTNIIKNTLSIYHPMSDETCHVLSKVTELKTLNENDIFEQENHRVLAEYVVVEGIIRAYLINSKGDDITINFFTSGKAITPVVLRNFNNNAFYNLQVLSKNASLLVFDRKSMQGEMQNIQDIKLFAFAVMMEDALHRSEREAILLKATGKEKLEWFRNRFKNLENLIQHYHIASYLGITPTSLSRIRAANS